MIGIYARQSLDKKDSLSIDGQIELCKKEFTGDYKVYTDKGYSGKNINRPAFTEMLNDIRQGLIDTVVVYKLDRISRSVLDFAGIIDEFEKHNVSFISHTEKFDTSTPMGRAMLSIIMVFAQLERETIQLRVRDNYYQRGKRGMFLGGAVPYGFTKEKIKQDGIKTSVFVPTKDINTVIDMFNQYAYSKCSLGNISNKLNEMKIPAPNGGNWDSNKVSRILRNPAYVRADVDIYHYYKSKGCIISNEISDFIGTNGCFLYGKREANERKYTNVENHVLSIALHEGVIDSNTWLLCQYKLDENKQIKNDGKGKHSWLVGVKCGYCGYAVSVVKSSHSNQKYFNCRGKTNLKVCNGHSHPLKVDEIESCIEQEIKNRIKSLKGIVIKQIENSNNNTKLKIAEIEEKIDNLINQMAESNGIVMKYIHEKIVSLDAEKNALLKEQQKDTLNNIRASSGEIIEKVNRWNLLDLEEKKSVCKYLIDKIRITDDKINIEWNI